MIGPTCCPRTPIIAVETLGSTVSHNKMYPSLCLPVSMFVWFHISVCCLYVYCQGVSSSLTKPTSSKGVSGMGINDSVVCTVLYITFNTNPSSHVHAQFVPVQNNFHPSKHLLPTHHLYHGEHRQQTCMCVLKLCIAVVGLIGSMFWKCPLSNTIFILSVYTNL